MRIGLLCNRPGAWPNSQVREALPDPLREWLDGQERAVLAEGLRTLRQAERESGWANAVAAMAEILETTGGIDRAGVCLAAARHAAGTEPVAYDEPVDLCLSSNRGGRVRRLIWTLSASRLDGMGGWLVSFVCWLFHE